MSKKLFMANAKGFLAKGAVTATNKNEVIKITGLDFIPDFIEVRITSDLSNTTPHSLLWLYSSHGATSIRTSSEGIIDGLGQSCCFSYTDNGYNETALFNDSIKLISGGFSFTSSSNTNGPIQAGDTFEWIAIKIIG